VQRFGQPEGLSTLFFVELWERFSYYGMRALLVLFMVAPLASGGLGFDTKQAALIYGNYAMAVYMLAIPGGFIADKMLGARRSVLLGGSVIALGHFSMAVPTLMNFYLGLVLIALGTGLFKPNISVLVGGLYGQDDPRRDSGFSIFYMGINIGAFIAPLITGFLAQSAAFKWMLAEAGLDPAHSWHWGFGAAGVGMALGLIVLWRNQNLLPAVEPEKPADRETLALAAAVVAGTFALIGTVVLSDQPGFEWIRMLFLAVPVALIAWFARGEDLEANRLAAMLVMFIASIVFWAIFEQAGVSIALFADQLTDNRVAGFAFPSSWYQSLNPLFVMLLAPIFAWIWIRLGDRQPSSPVKFSLGLFFLATSFLLMVPAAQLTLAGKVSPLWLVGLFLLQTIGELLLSPVGLSMMTKLAPTRMVGLMMGIWFLGDAFGNKLAGVLASSFDAANPETLAGFFAWQAALVLVATVVLVTLTPWVKGLMRGVK
jgi:POT family proton-dependent oligopeptide transporter